MYISRKLYVEYINYDESLRLVTYGTEGKHYNMVNGKPQYTEEWLNIRSSDNNRFKLESFGLVGYFIGADPREENLPCKER